MSRMKATSVSLRVLCGLLLFTTGCDSAQLMDVLNQIDKPTASIAGASLSNLSLDGVTIDFDVDVHNPYAFALPLVGMGYELGSGGKQLVAGEIDSPGAVPARGKRTVSVPVALRFADVMNILGGVKPGSILPYEAALNLRADAPGIGPLTLPLRHSGQAPIPAVPQVTLASVEWSKLSWTEAAATLRVGVINTNQFPLELSQLSYALSLAGTPVANASVSKAVSFKADGDEQVIELPLSISPASAGMALFSALRGDGSSYNLAGGMKARTPFGIMNMPYSSNGQTVFNR